MIKVNKLNKILSGLLLAGCLLPVSLYAVAGEDGLLKANGVSTEGDAIEYYATIDPDHMRMTQDAWRDVNGFNDPANEIVVVKGHKNVSDLGFYRKIEMVIDKRDGYEGNVAFTTFNYFTEDDAIDDVAGELAASIVNMEYSPGPDGDHITKFYIYNGKTRERLLSTIFDPDLTKAEELYLPSGCTSCHGGEDGFGHEGDIKGGFLAFDFNVFEFGSLVTRADQEENVKKLNEGVLMTNPPRAVKKLAYGLYGGRDLPLDTQNSAFIPSDWAGEEELYGVIVTDCLGCHTLSESAVLSLNWWKRNTGELQEHVLEDENMPNSPFAHRRFFSETNNHEIVRDALDRFGAGSGGM